MTNKLSANMTRRAFLRSCAGVSTLACVPRALWAGSAEEQASPVVLRCVIMSDIHYYGGAQNEEVKRFHRAMTSAYAYADSQPYKWLDAAMIVGDMTDNGNEKQLDLFLKSVDETFRDETTLLPCMGNHEFWPGPKELWEEKFGVPSNNVHEINGYRFIGTSPEKGTMKNGDYLYVVDWLDKQLADATAADPAKPVFVFQHYPVTPTIYGSRGLDNCGVPDLFDTLAKYPNVIDFAGHSHYLMSDPRIAWQGAFTAFGTSTLSYIFLESMKGRYESFPINRYEYSEYYVMEVHADNSVVVMPYDNLHDRFFDYVFRVAAPGSDGPRPYTDARYSTSAAPVWPKDSALTLVKADASRVYVEIPQAVCPDVVHSYRLDLQRADADGKWSDLEPQYFWSRYFDHPVPASVPAVVEGLDATTKYRVKAVALNPFMRPSEDSLTLEFTTTPEPDGIDRHAEKPNANFFDARVVDGKFVNAPIGVGSEPKPFETVGELKIEHDDELDADLVVCDGSAAFLRFKCSPDDYERLRRVTLAALVKPDPEKKSGRCTIMGATEGRGCALIMDYDKKSAVFIASISGSYYRSLNATIDMTKAHEIVGVYDGLYQILYVDGKEAARLSLRGFFSYPTEPSAQAFCVGADTASGGKGSDFFVGKLARARVYTWPLSPEQIGRL